MWGSINKKERQFLKLWGGSLLSTFGSSVSSFAVLLWVQSIYKNPLLLGYLFFAYMAPQIYMSIFAGHIVDRFDRKTIIILSDLMQMLFTISLLIAIMMTGDDISFMFIILVKFLSGVFSGIQSIAFMSSNALFIEKKRLLRYNGFLQIFKGGISILGPLAAFPLLQWLGIKPLLYLDITTFAVAFIIITFVQFPVITKQRPSFKLKTILDGFKVIKKNLSLMTSIKFFAMNNFLGGLLAGLIIPFIMEKAGDNSPWVAYNTSLVALGVVLGGVLVVRFEKHIIRPFYVMFLVTFIAAIMGRMIVSFMDIAMIIGLLLLIRNSIIPIQNACNDTIWQSIVDINDQGKAFGTRRFIAQGLYPIGMLLGPLMAGLLKHTFLADYFGGSIALLFMIVGLLELLSITLLIPKWQERF